jgi:lysophospholipase L1-like esterase
MRPKTTTLLAALAVVLLAIGLAPTASASSAPVYYVALGDSLAAGVQPLPESSDNTLMAPNGTRPGYVDLIYAAERAEVPNLHLRNFGCPGATTRSIISGGSTDLNCGYGTGSQLDTAVDFLQAHPGEIAFITIDIGANDLAPCFVALDFSSDCLNTGGFQPLSAVTANLQTILAQLRAAAGSGVPIVGMNYYDPFLGFWVFGAPGLAVPSVEFIVGLNDALEGVYQAAGAPVADVETAFAVTDFASTRTLPGFGTVPVNVYNACTLTWFCSRFDVHPNDAGYGVIAQAFEAVLP